MILQFPKTTLLPLLLLAMLGCVVRENEVVIGPPEELYGDLFLDVQSNTRIFSDSKTFVDCIPKTDPATIRKQYSRLHDTTDSALTGFIRTWFIVPETKPESITAASTINEQILKLWEILKRPPDENKSGTLLPLPNAYIVPGGRFREVYYWDSYFTMLGLRADHQDATIKAMIDNFSWLIDTFGFVPNGNRTYYLSRSQPPFYSCMVRLLAESEVNSTWLKYLPRMQREYEFWMDGAERLADTPGAYKRVVRMPGGEILNRYWDDKSIPRSESYREDVKTAENAVAYQAGTDKMSVYRNLRAAAESGWDFSSRWLATDSSGRYCLPLIHTTEIVPVDLNALIYNIEHSLYEAFRVAGEMHKAEYYRRKAECRKKAVSKYCWNDSAGFFMDYHAGLNRQTSVVSLAGVYPLFFHLADTVQAVGVAAMIRERLLKPGGVVTSVNSTGQQWDAPNGWAPLQWITIIGLRNYGHTGLSDDIKARWLRLNGKVFFATHKMMEKYDVVDTSRSGCGGEYPTQDGFGWTNGVYRGLSEVTK